MSSSELDAQIMEAPVEPADPLLRLQAASSAPAFYRFVLTGGPCAGKTTALARLSAHFSENGFSVYTVPEAATLLFTNGAALQDFAVEGMPLAFQWSLLKMQIALEEGFERIARAKGKPAVLLCDRGLMDGSAYMDPAQWAQMLAGMQLDTMACREGRYDAVFHLVTAAIGAEAHYSLENNVARSETVAEAADTDRKLQAAWLGHPHHHIIGNVPGEGFNDKIERVVSAASQQLGLPTKRREHKYLLKEVPHVAALPVPCEEVLVETVYLLDSHCSVEQQQQHNTSNNSECTARYSFLRKRSNSSSNSSAAVYSVTRVETWADSSRSESNRIISSREYSTLLQLSDPARVSVTQRRIAFVWAHRSYVIHLYVAPVSDFAVLHVYGSGSSSGSSEEQQQQLLPPFLAVDTDSLVRNDEEVSAYAIALQHGAGAQ